MGVISNETPALMKVVREDYPKTWDWMKHKANWEGMCMGAICESYSEHIKALVEEEKNSV